MNYTDEYGKTYELRFHKAHYLLGGKAITVECSEDGYFWEPYATVTKYISETKDDCCAYLDTNNVGHLIQAMIDAGYIELTGRVTISGWCMYPEGRFNDEWLAGLDELA